MNNAISVKNQTLPPAQLLVGEPSLVAQQACAMLQQALCPQAGCGQCRDCVRVTDRSHYQVLWLSPEKGQYTRAELTCIGDKIAFALDPREQFFFVLESVELLSATCANMLLKSIEEPPAGYHFLLLTERRDMVLPTIVSRCVEYHYASEEQEAPNQGFIAAFTAPNLTDMRRFAELFDQASPTEQGSVALLDQIRGYWHEQLKAGLLQNDHLQVQKAKILLETIETSSKRLPMPGSVKLFWRNFYLNCSIAYVQGTFLR